MIKLENVTYIYTPGGPYETHALQEVNLEIPDGDFVGLIGHTGSGKSTLVQIMAGLVRPTSGKAYVGGVDLADRKSAVRDLKGKVGLVFQYPEHQLFEETVFKDVAFGPKNLGLSEKEIEERVNGAIDAVNLGRRTLEKSPFDLSGGQKRRVAIAGVLAMNPEILILDEPTAGLDPVGRDEILSLLKTLHKAGGKTIILVSHSMEDVAKTVQSVVVMHKSRVALSGPLDQVFSKGQALGEMGLGVPQITVIMDKLREAGVGVPEGIFTVRQAANAIAGLLKGGEGA